ncbi:ankyrin repeat protein, partial [Trichoderma virens Gv29-8]
LLIYATFIAVVKADGLSDISNNLASDLGPLLALFGDEITRQYLSESIGFLDYFIFAMAPIGIIATITAAIRICGSSALRAFIGRAQEGDGTTEAELCTSTSADVCELFNKSGIARVLGRPDIVELIYTPDDPKDERFHIFTKYLDRPVRHYWEKNQFSGSGHALFSKIFFSSDESTEFAPKPNLSLNVGVRRRPDWIFYVVAIVGFILQAGILVFAGTAVLLLGWNIHESDGEVITQNYAPGIFIVGTIVLCSGVWGCATLIGQTTTEMYYQRKSKSSPDVLYWIQPGPQVIGDQFFYPFAYSDANKVEQRNRIWMSSTQSSNRKKSEVLAFIAVLLVLFGYVGQFIGLRGLNAWISIAQLAITLFMSILRSILRMDRLDKNDNCLDGRRDLVAGHELDWLAFNIAGLEFQQRQERLKSNQLPKEDKSQEYQEKLQQLLKNRIRLANLTGHLDNSEEAKRITHWKDESIRVRTKARSLKAALCGAAAALLRDQTSKDEVHLRLVSGLSYGDTNDKNSVVTIEMEPPKGLNQINWTLDSSKLEAVLGLWLWSIVSKDYESYKRLKDSSDSTNPRSEKPTAKIFRVVSACTEEQGWDDSVDADMSIWLGSRDLNITQQTLDLNAGLNHVYSLADTWTEMPDTPEIWEYDLTPEVSKKPVQRICGWNLIYDAFRGNNSGTRSHDTTIIQGRVKVKGFPVKDTGNSLLEICAQELFVAFMLSMKNQGFREFSELSVNELAGNVRLENPLVSALTECFTGHSLGTYSDAISCLIPILRSDVTSNREQLLSALAQAATKYRRDGRWEGAEIILRWGCHYYCLLSQRSADKASLFTELLRELGELYRWSLAQGQNSDRQDFGKNGIQWMRENFGNAPNESIQAAIVLDYEEVVKEITGKDLQDLSMLKYTSAVASRKRGQSLVLLCLMTSRRDINSSEFSHVLPFAARNGWHEVVSALLEMKANPNSQDSDGRTAASHCAELGRQELLQRLIAKGADLDLADKRDMTPLDYTAKNGRKDVLKLLMKIDSLDLNRKMYNGRSALWLAIDQHHVKVMKELLDNGANVNEKDDHGFWPLQMAVKRGHEDAVELLLSQRSIIAWRNAARDS